MSVNIKKLISQSKTYIKDRELFSFLPFKNHLAMIANGAMSGYRKKRPIKVELEFNNSDKLIAVTDNETILINTDNVLIHAIDNRPEKYEGIIGLLAHEIGHCLFTDFQKLQSYINSLSNGYLYPQKPVFSESEYNDNVRDIIEYLNPADPTKTTGNRARFIKVAQKVENIIEDGYVEEKITQKFPGTFTNGLNLVNSIQIEKTPPIERMPQDDITFIDIQDILLSYSKYGDIKPNEVDKESKRTGKLDMRLHMMYECLPTMNDGLYSGKMQKRIESTNNVIAICWEYVKPMLDKAEEENDNDLSQLRTSSQIGTGTSTPVEDGEITESSSSASKGRSARTDQARAKAKEKSDTEDSEKGDKKPEEAKAGSDPEEENDEEPEEAKGDDSSGEDEDDSDENGVQETKTEHGKEAMPRIPYKKTYDVKEYGGEKDVSYDEYCPDAYAHSAKEIDKLLNEAAEAKVFNNLETEHAKELNVFAKNVKLNNIHRGIKTTVHRMVTVDMKYKILYDEVKSGIQLIAKRLEKSVAQELKDKREGGKRKNLYSGKKFEARSVCRHDGKVFSKTNLPSDMPTLVIGVIVDESGSMCGDKCVYARTTALILYNFCTDLKIPVCINGHSSNGDSLELNSYAEFNTVDSNDKYRLMDIGAGGCNRDGAALHVMAEKLHQRQEDVKLLIIISDGQPASNGYGGSAAEEDIQSIVKYYNKRGIQVYAAAIDEDKQSIKRIYGEGFLDITDLKKLPDTLGKLIKKNIRI